MLFLFLASLSWAFSFPLIKLFLINKLNSYFIAIIRLGGAFVLFASFWIFNLLWQQYKAQFKFKSKAKTQFRKSNYEHNNKGVKNVLELFFLGFIQFGVMYIFYIYSYNYLKAYEVALFTVLTPIYVFLFGYLFKINTNKQTLIFPLLALIGGGIISYKDILIHQGFWLGFFILQIANISFALGEVYIKKIKKISLRELTIMYFGAFIGSLFIAIIFTGTKWIVDLSILDIKTILILLYLAIIPTGFGFALWNIGAKKVSIPVLSVFNNLKIPLAVIVSILIFGESVNWTSFVIGVLILIFALIFSYKGINYYD